MSPSLPNCLVCKSNRVYSLYHAADVPLVPNAPLAETQLNDELFATLDIVSCATCGLVFNAAFDASLIDKIYTDNYSSGVSRSAENMKRYNEMITDIIAPQNVAGKTVVEIGASDFAFSELMLSHGARRIIAFEPSNLFTMTDPKIVHVPTFFDTQAVPGGMHNVDLIVMRHVLEHLPDPVHSLQRIAGAASSGMMIYIEVPNVQDVIGQHRFYDFFYEHVTYWSPSLLSKLMECLGFKTVTVRDLANGQHFGLLCRKVSLCDMVLADVAWPAVAYNGKQLATATKHYLGGLESAIKSYKKVAIYGAGNHGLGIASCLHFGPKGATCILDSNAMKHGKYAPKSHIPILKPTHDLVATFDAIFVIAPLHQAEICAFITDKLHFVGDLWRTYPNVELCSGKQE